MTTEIPWIGYRTEMKYNLQALNEQGFDVKKARSAYAGYNLLQEQNFPLMILQDWFQEIGQLNVPIGMTVSKRTKLTCYFIGLVRKLSNYERTPIIVPHYLNPSEIEQMTSAGATDFVDLRGSPDTIKKDLVDAIQKYVPQKP